MWTIARRNEYHRNYYHLVIKKDPRKYKAKLQSGTWTRRKKKYGITRKQYLELLEKQHGRCYVCLEYHGENLRVDHDHRTGDIRALLCSSCNAMLGQAKENPSRLRAAADYLEQHSNAGDQ